MSNTFHDIKIKKITEETNHAKSFEFDIPENLAESFAFKAGQYLTLKFDLEGEEERRSYSLSSAPFEKKWRVCVKRVQDGKVSNYMCDQLKEGDHVSIMAPDGRFKYVADAERQAQHYLFAAGSGITPILAIAKEILEDEPLSTVYLLYGNNSEDQVIYKNELESMEKKYGDQFHVKHAYSSVEEKKGLLSSIFKKTSVELPYFPGRVSKDTIKKFFQSFPMKNPQHCHAFICGPGTMNEDVKKYLMKHSMLKNQIHFESFGTTDGEQTIVLAGGFEGISDVSIELDGKTIDLQIDSTTTVLQGLLDAGYDPPHSCCSGACSSCMASLKTGQVTMDVSHALDEDDIADGYILTCQSRVAAAKIHIVYE